MKSAYCSKKSSTSKFFGILLSVVLVVGLMPLTALGVNDAAGKASRAAEQAAAQTQDKQLPQEETQQQDDVVSPDEAASADEESAVQLQDETAATEEVSPEAEQAGLQPLADDVAPQAITTIDSITNLRVDNTVAPATATVSNGVFTGSPLAGAPIFRGMSRSPITTVTRFRSTPTSEPFSNSTKPTRMMCATLTAEISSAHLASPQTK